MYVLAIMQMPSTMLYHMILCIENENSHCVVFAVQSVMMMMTPVLLPPSLLMEQTARG